MASKKKKGALHSGPFSVFTFPKIYETNPFFMKITPPSFW